VRRSYKFLLRPTSRQQHALNACLADHRELYNAALEERREAYRKRKVSVRYGDQSAQLKDIRKADPDGQGRWSFSSQQATLRRLDKAFAAFFRRINAGQAPGYPRFKGAGWFDSVEWPKDRDGCRWDSAPTAGATRVYLQGIGHVRVHAHRAISGRLKTIGVKRDDRRWFVILSCDDIPAEPLPAMDAAVGVDLGIAAFLAASDGTLVENPRHARVAADELGLAQQALSRSKRASGRRGKTRRRVSAIHRRIGRQRVDHHHKTALALVRDFDFIAHEDLAVANMLRRPKPRPDGKGGFLPNGAAAKAGLNRSISDAGWGQFISILNAKAESAGRQVIAVNPRHTSQTCHECGHVAAGNRVAQAVFRCLACGHEDHADVNAARNILRAGLVLREATA
jgi:putative transposase